MANVIWANKTWFSYKNKDGEEVFLDEEEKKPYVVTEYTKLDEKGYGYQFVILANGELYYWEPKPEQ